MQSLGWLVIATMLLVPVGAHAVGDVPRGLEAGPQVTLGLRADGGDGAAFSPPRTLYVADAAYQVVFECIDQDSQSPLANDPVCPSFVLDQHDAMTQPAMAVDPRNPKFVGFNALHGGRGAVSTSASEPPTIRSRDNEVHQPHTTHRTGNAGGDWIDMPYYAPDTMAQEGWEIYGEDNAIALDGAGRVYLASLYAIRDPVVPFGASPEPFRYAVGVWKAGTLHGNIDYHTNVLVLRAGNDGFNVIKDLHAVHEPVADRVAVTWLEDGASDVPGAFVRMHTTDPDVGGIWNNMSLEPRIGPCTSTSNPVARAGEIVIGCMPPEGATENGTMLLYGIHAETHETRLIRETPTKGDAPRLVARGEQGHLMTVSTTIDSEGPHLWVAYGDADDRWSDLRDHIALATNPSPVAIEMSRVTAAVFRPSSGNLHIVYMERFVPSDGAATLAGEAQFYKSFIALRAEADVQAAVDLQVGQATRADVSATSSGVSIDAFEDLHDALVVWEDPHSNDEREYIAFGDHGYVRFAQVTERGALPAPVLVGPQVVPIPLASAGVNPLVYGAAAGVMSMALVTRMLARRNKAAVELETGA